MGSARARQGRRRLLLGRVTISPSHRSNVRLGRSSSAASVSAGRNEYVSSARDNAMRDSSRHSLSTLSHSRPSTAAFQSRHCNSAFGESGCAAIPKPPRRWTSSSTSRASPASRYGACGNPQRDEMAIIGADFHGVDEQHAVHVARRIGRAGRVAVIGEHHEVESGAMSGAGNPLGRAGAVGSHGVHVNRAAGDQGIRW